MIPELSYSVTRIRRSKTPEPRTSSRFDQGLAGEIADVPLRLTRRNRQTMAIRLIQGALLQQTLITHLRLAVVAGYHRRFGIPLVLPGHIAAAHR